MFRITTNHAHWKRWNVREICSEHAIAHELRIFPYIHPNVQFSSATFQTTATTLVLLLLLLLQYTTLCFYFWPLSRPRPFRPPIHQQNICRAQRKSQSQINVSSVLRCNNKGPALCTYIHVCTRTHTRACFCMCIVNAARSCHRCWVFSSLRSSSSCVCHAVRHTHTRIQGTHAMRTNEPRTHTSIARSLAYSHMHKYITGSKWEEKKNKKNFRPAWPWELWQVKPLKKSPKIKPTKVITDWERLQIQSVIS